MRVLITGGAGFIGSHLADKLIEHDFQVVLLDNLSSGSIGNIDHLLGREDVTFIKEDVLDIAACSGQIGAIDIVVHLSALVSVQESLADPRRSFRNNAEATSLIFEFARRSKVKGLIYASSAAVYGANADAPVSELSGLSPLSPYAADKAYAEHLGSVYWNAFELPSLGLRFFNVYGPRQDPGSPYSGVISKFIEACLNDRAPTIYGDGRQTRDFVYVEDLVTAIVIGARDLVDGKGGQIANSVLNIGSGKSVSVLDLARIISTECKADCGKLLFEPGKTGEVRHSQADISRARTAISWEPMTTLKEGIDLTVLFYKKRRDRT